MLRPDISKQSEDHLRQYIEQFDVFPGDHILALFYLKDPWIFHEKLQQFRNMDPESDRHHHFMALEHWVNSSIPITKGVALDCFLDWGIHNVLLEGKWRVGGRNVTPDSIQQPTFVACPTKDRIVPLKSSLPLAKALPNAHTIQPASGHVGMIVGGNGKKVLWNPLDSWLLK